MVPHAKRLPSSDLALDRWLAEAVEKLSSSPSARAAAREWLTTYDRARETGNAHAEACDEADVAYRQVIELSRQTGTALETRWRAA